MGTLGKKTILLVDDEPDLIYVTQKMLQAHQYHVLVASNGEEALFLTYEKKPDLLLLDLLMPKIDGYQVCQTLRQDQRTKTLPIIVLSAKPKSKEDFLDESTQPDFYMTKPVMNQELLKNIHSLLQKNS